MNEQLQTLIETVREGAKYRQIHPDLVEQIARHEMQKERSWKDTVKAVRNKLHQVGGAYQSKPINYERLKEELAGLGTDLQDPKVKIFCQKAMSLHASTRERLPILNDFYVKVFNDLHPIRSVIDAACGLNPLALPWMPLNPEVEFFACDIYADQMDFLNAFFNHFSINGRAYSCDLTQHIPREPVQVALILKTIPCLEQIDKQIGQRLLAGLPAENLVVSFPAKSLGGKEKGMRQFYGDHFTQLVSTFPWQIDSFSFDNEEVFLIRK